MKYDELSYERRVAESQRLRHRYPSSVPVVVRCDFIEKRQYIVPYSVTVGQFLHTLRQSVSMHASQALFLFVGNNTLVPSAATMLYVTDHHLEDDGFLLMTLEKEKVFG